MIRKYEFSFDALGISAEKIAAGSGCAAAGMPERAGREVSNILEQYSGMVRPVAVAGVFPAHLEDNVLLCGSERFSLSSNIAGQIRGLKKIAVFICTIGAAVEDQSIRLLETGELLQGYIFDVFGSVAAEGTAELMQRQVETQAAVEGFGISSRFSPGYCGWPVSEQKGLFRLLDQVQLPVKLSESAMMKPLKSVSGFIALGTGLRQGYACSACDNRNQCLYRNSAGRKIFLKP